jgi:hypothetical protein
MTIVRSNAIDLERGLLDLDSMTVRVTLELEMHQSPRQLPEP